MLPNQKKSLEAFRSSIKCVWCKEMLCNPATMPCGHHYCYDCAEVSLQKKNGCGICNHPFHRKDVGRDHKLNSIVEHVKQILEIAARAEQAEKNYFAHLEAKKRFESSNSLGQEHDANSNPETSTTAPRTAFTDTALSFPRLSVSQDKNAMSGSSVNPSSPTSKRPINEVDEHDNKITKNLENFCDRDEDGGKQNNTLLRRDVMELDSSLPSPSPIKDTHPSPVATNIEVMASEAAPLRPQFNSPSLSDQLRRSLVTELETRSTEGDIHVPISPNSGHNKGLQKYDNEDNDIEEIREIPDEYSQSTLVGKLQQNATNEMAIETEGKHENTSALDHLPLLPPPQQSEAVSTQDDIESLHSSDSETQTTAVSQIDDPDASRTVDAESGSIPSSDIAIRPRVLSGTNLSPEYTAKLSTLAESLGIRLVYDTLASGVTHLVAGTVLVPNVDKDPEERYPATKRTIKYLFALLEGAWILSPEWIDACLEHSAFVPESPHEISGCLTHASRYFPRIARERALSQPVLPLAGLKISLLPPLSRIKLEEAEQLIVRAGAEYCEAGSPLDCSVRTLLSLVHQNHIWITSFDPAFCDVERKQEYQLLSNYLVNPPIILDQMWLLESISSLQPAPYLAYGVRGRFFFNGFTNQ